MRNETTEMNEVNEVMDPSWIKLEDIPLDELPKLLSEQRVKLEDIPLDKLPKLLRGQRIKEMENTTKPEVVELPLYITKDDLQYVGHTTFGLGDEPDLMKTVIVLDSNEYFFSKIVLRSVLKLWDAEVEKEEEFYEEIDDKLVFSFHFYTSIPWDDYNKYFHPNEEASLAK
jgi:hypothetical protein